MASEITPQKIRIAVLSQIQQRQRQLSEVLNSIGLQVVVCTELDNTNIRSINSEQVDALLVDLHGINEAVDAHLLDNLDLLLEDIDIPIFFDETPNQVTTTWAKKLANKLAVIVDTAIIAQPADAPSTLIRLAIATNAENEINRLASILETLGLKTSIHTELNDNLINTLDKDSIDALLVDLRHFAENDPNLSFFEAFVDELTEQATLPVYFDESPENNIEAWALKLAAKLTNQPAYQLAERLGDQISQPKPQVALAIVFADICGSTHLYESLGDHDAQQLIGQCIQFLTDVTHQHKGIVIKTIGDEVMCTFPTADLAVEAALMMQHDLNQSTQKTSKQYNILGIRIGIHFGSVVKESNDIFGDSVNVAARMAALAKSDQIITTGQSIQSLSPVSSVHYRHIDRSSVRGKREEFDIFEILSVEEYQFEATIKASHKIIHQRQAYLQLRYEESEFMMDQMTPKITIGRSEKNDIVIDHALISRFHARIELYRGKFVLYDQSFNGTFLVTQEGDDSFLHRDYTPLKGKGIIALGSTIGNNKHIIFYDCAT